LHPNAGDWIVIRFPAPLEPRGGGVPDCRGTGTPVSPTTGRASAVLSYMPYMIYAGGARETGKPAQSYPDSPFREFQRTPSCAPIGRGQADCPKTGCLQPNKTDLACDKVEERQKPEAGDRVAGWRPWNWASGRWPWEIVEVGSRSVRRGMQTKKGIRFIFVLFLVFGGLFLAWSIRKFPNWISSGTNQRDATASRGKRSTRFLPKDPQGAVAEEERARNPNILIPIPSDNAPPRLPKEFPTRWEFMESTSRERSSEIPPTDSASKPSPRRERMRPASHRPVSPSGKVGAPWQGEPETAWREAKAPESTRKCKELVPVRASER